MIAALFALIGCSQKSTSTQPIAQDFSPQAEARWIEVNPRFASAFDYLRATDLRSLEPGTYRIDSIEVYITISDARLRSEQEALLEVHDNYYDIQIPIDGVERYGYRDRAECSQPRAEMDAEKDIQFFDDPIASVIGVQPMQFIVFAPEHAHAPMIGEGTLRKAVVKVRN